MGKSEPARRVGEEQRSTTRSTNAPRCQVAGFHPAPAGPEEQGQRCDLTIDHVRRHADHPTSCAQIRLVALRYPSAGGFLCGFLLFRVDKPVSAHRIKSRGGGLKCARPRATPTRSCARGAQRERRGEAAPRPYTVRQGRSDQGSSPCSTPPRSPSQTPSSSRHRHRIPRWLGAGRWNRRQDRHECRST